MGVKLAAASVLVLCALWFKNPQVNVPGNITADTTYQFTDTSANTFDDTIAPPVVLFIH